MEQDNSIMPIYPLTPAVKVQDELMPNNQSFNFMSLPPEIRTMIFKQLLVMPSPIFFHHFVFDKNTKSWEDRNKPFATTQPAKYRTQDNFHRKSWKAVIVDETSIIVQSTLLDIFRVSKAIYGEVIAIYFGCNIFDFDNLDRFERFGKKLGVDARWEVRTP